MFKELYFLKLVGIFPRKLFKEADGGARIGPLSVGAILYSAALFIGRGILVSLIVTELVDGEIVDINSLLGGNVLMWSWVLLDVLCLAVFVKNHNHFVKLCKKVMKLARRNRLGGNETKFTEGQKFFLFLQFLTIIMSSFADICFSKCPAVLTLQEAHLMLCVLAFECYLIVFTSITNQLSMVIHNLIGVGGITIHEKYQRMEKNTLLNCSKDGERQIESNSLGSPKIVLSQRGKRDKCFMQALQVVQEVDDILDETMQLYGIIILILFGLMTLTIVICVYFCIIHGYENLLFIIDLGSFVIYAVLFVVNFSSIPLWLEDEVRL